MFWTYTYITENFGIYFLDRTILANYFLVTISPWQGLFPVQKVEFNGKVATKYKSSLKGNTRLLGPKVVPKYQRPLLLDIGGASLSAPLRWLSRPRRRTAGRRPSLGAAARSTLPVPVSAWGSRYSCWWACRRCQRVTEWFLLFSVMVVILSYPQVLDRT